MTTDVRNPLDVSAAFLAEVQTQRAEAIDQMERAAASLDDWALSAARGRLRDLEELLDRNDAGRAAWATRRTLDALDALDALDDLDDLDDLDCARPRRRDST